MLRHVWSLLKPLLPRRGQPTALLIGAESLAAGLLEATLLVVVVATALKVSVGGETVQVPMPGVGKSELTPRAALVLAAGAGMVVLVLHAHTARITAGLAAAVMRNTRDRAISAFASASWARQSQEREGALQETVSTLAMQSSSLVISLSNLVTGCLGVVALLLAAAVVNPFVTVIVIGCGGALFGVLRPVARLTRRRSREHVRRNSGFTEQMSQWTTLAMELRVFGVDGAEADRLAQVNREAATALERTQFASRLGSFLYRDAAVLFLVGAVAALHSVGSVDVAAVGAVVLLVVRSLGHAQTANAAIQVASEQSPSLEALVLRLETLEAAATVPGSRVVEEIDVIDFVDVSYDYEPGRPGITGVNISIQPGEALGVVGPSGAGKSTLVQVVLRLRPPTSGEVRVSGVGYEEVAPASWHRLVAHVPQEPKLFQGTVAENIAFLRTGITRAAIEEAAAAAHVLDEIRNLPDGFDTELGPRGAGLSGGQAQRVAIARALVGRPQVLVLDEPTSALDVRSEQLLQETIAELKGRVTLVIVAHRMATLACCDRVVAMKDGRVCTIGSLEEALAEVSLPHDGLEGTRKPQRRARRGRSVR